MQSDIPDSGSFGLANHIRVPEVGFASTPAANVTQTGDLMRADGRPLCSRWRCSAHRIARLVWAGMMMIALVACECLPITLASSYYRADQHHLFASEPQRGLATVSAKHAADALNGMSLRFEACDSRMPARYLARTNESTIYLSATEATLSLRADEGAGRLGRGADLGTPRNARSPRANEQLPEPRRDRAAPRPTSITTVRMQLLGANRRARVIGENQLAAKTNYFVGNDSGRWRTGVANYERVKVNQIYRGVDVVYYGAGRQLEYDFKVAPGASYKAIRLRFDGARSIHMDESGDLLIETSAGTLRHRKPVAYQEFNGARKEIAARYVINRRGEVGLAVECYDESLPLIIDPVLSYATYFGSLTGRDSINAIAFDREGDAYVVGSTLSLDLPTTPGAFQTASTFTDVFIAKLNATGKAVLYVTYLGGNGDEFSPKIAVDGEGNAYVTGVTSSVDFPTTPNAFQRVSPGVSEHPFVVKLNPNGTALIYGTYLGDSLSVVGIGVDAEGRATIAGTTTSTRFPTTKNAFQQTLDGFQEAFVARLNRDGSALVYATYLGGEADDFATCLALDASGNAYIGGRTLSDNFPATKHAYQRVNKSDVGFVTKLDPAGDRLVYSTFLGDDLKIVNAIVVDQSGNAYVTGSTDRPNLQTTPNAFQTALAGGADAFVMKLNESGSELVYSTYLGGLGNDSGNAIAVDSLGQAYVTGSTFSRDFPVSNALQPQKKGRGLLKSTDGGIQWDEVPAPAVSVNSLAIDPVTTALFAQTPSEIISSTDGGDHWSVRTTGFFGSLINDPVRSGILYALNMSRIFKSTNSGADWQNASGGISPSGSSVLAIDPKTPDTLYLGIQASPDAPPSDVRISGVGDGGMFKSTDGGLSWQPINFGLAANGVRCLAIDPNMTSTVYAGTNAGGLLKSTDGGATWVRVGGSVLRLAVDPFDSTLYATNGNTLSKSTNGGISWTSTFIPSLGSIESLVINPKTPFNLYAADFSGLYRTTDGGATWSNTLQGVFVTSIVPDSQRPSTIYVVANPSSDAFVARLSAAGNALVYSTFYGGVADDSGTAIAGDAFGNVYVGGISYSADFPVTPNSYQTRGARLFTGFVIRIADPITLRITGVAIKGKKLLVSGEGFHNGAVITVNNVGLTTLNDAVTPSTLLISKKGGKQIAPGQTVTIRVRDADGTLSDGFSFTRRND